MRECIIKKRYNILSNPILFVKHLKITTADRSAAQEKNKNIKLKTVEMKQYSKQEEIKALIITSRSDFEIITVTLEIFLI